MNAKHRNRVRAGLVAVALIVGWTSWAARRAPLEAVDEAAVSSAQASQPVAKPAASPAAQPAADSGEDEIATFIAHNRLPSDAWSRYEGRSLDELTELQEKLDQRYQALKAQTDEQTERRHELLVSGNQVEADRVLAAELAPAFEARRQLGAEATLLARAKLDRRSQQLALAR